MALAQLVESFYAPYCLWDGDNITQQSFAEWDELQHVVLMFSSSQKHVSSSQAHTLVQTSDGFAASEQYQRVVLI